MPEPTAPGNAPMMVEQEQPVMMQAPVDQPTAPPRLSHVVTLGEESYAPMPVPGAASQGNGTVVINNNVTVGGGYGYGGYGYGGYAYGYGGTGYGRGYYRGGGYTGSSTYQASHAAGGSNSWGATGWEGAGRTAAPGHTPNVGGNWSAPPSAGPRPMR